jgi:hypothetical protein
MASRAVDAWKGVAALVQSLVPESNQVQMSDGAAQIKWVLPSRLALIGGRHVQALLSETSNGFEVRFERLFAQAGRTNWEPTPGSTYRGPEIWKTTPVEGAEEIFWRIDDLPPVNSERLAIRIVENLKTYYENYSLRAIGL